MTSVDSIRRKMNQLGSQGHPFFFAFDFELSEGLFSDHPFEEKDFFFSLSGQTNAPAKLQPDADGRAYIKTYPMTIDEYAEKFKIAYCGLARGDSYLLNLTGATPIECPLTLEEIFYLSDSPFRLWVPGRLVAFSPERFVKICDHRIVTCPMKGTIDASLPDAEGRILDDFKETCEHATIVDLLRNDLSLFAENVRVARYRYVESVVTRQRTILQVSSEIEGTLPRHWPDQIGDLIWSMLPCGSCSGAPKESTVRIIQKAEGQPRGYYTGVFGLFDGKDLDSAVLIRFIEQTPQGLKFRSGGGITANSRMEDEYQEMLDKIYLPFV
ncbi:MAG: aminodeoxychorismate synthase component I [Deltaproteobacteria bacterium]|jgi:para-aminobenzoate synthetase component 1|nr:aminodeoxychorismate synthase component I [Deltaproteobacteria bacterium]